MKDFFSALAQRGDLVSPVFESRIWNRCSLWYCARQEGRYLPHIMVCLFTDLSSVCPAPVRQLHGRRDCYVDGEDGVRTRRNLVQGCRRGRPMQQVDRQSAVYIISALSRTGIASPRSFQPTHSSLLVVPLFHHYEIRYFGEMDSQF